MLYICTKSHRGFNNTSFSDQKVKLRIVVMPKTETSS